MRLFAFLLLASSVIIYSPTQAQEASIKEEVWSIKTYPFSDPDPVPILRSNPDIYPYFAFDGFTSEGVMKKWKVVVLENKYLKVFVLPEVGGKVFGGIEKSTGREFIYKNDVIKFRRIALRGPWTSGGIEFNFGIIGHTPSTATPVDYAVRSNPDGSVTCFVGTLDLPSRTRWSVAITLPRDKAYLETRPFWFNPTPYAQSYYVWTTSAITAANDLQYFYPGRYVVPHSFSIENAPWPRAANGRDQSWYKENDFEGSKSHFVFGQYDEFFGAYWHDLRFGMGHWARHDDMPGQKVWIWSLARDGAIWENLLTDTRGQYSEPQAGRLLSQVDHEFFQPYSGDTWQELWFPVKEIGGIVAASPYAAMNVTRIGDSLKIGICALATFSDTLTVSVKKKVVAHERLHVATMGVASKRIALPAGTSGYTVSIGEKVRYSTEESSVLTRPIEYREFPAGTAEAFYRSGEFHEKQRHFWVALREYAACLGQDSNHISALTRTALLYGRRGEYERGLSFATRALRLVKYDPGANYAFGILARKLGLMADAKETLGWAARSLEYRSNAYAQLAEIALQEQMFDRAIEYAGKAQHFNTFNLNARLILATAFRLKGNGDSARATLAGITAMDPLCHEADVERCLIDNSSKGWVALRKSIGTELAHETYLELATRYVSLGLFSDAITLLEQSPEHPMVHYWLGYLRRDTEGGAAAHLAEATALGADFVFPFREEDIPVLQWAIDVQREEWKPRYYLGMLLWGKAREEEALHLLDQVVDAPLAPFFITRAALRKRLNASGVEQDLEKACALEPVSWRPSHALVDRYAETGRYVEASNVSRDAFRRFPGNVVVQMDYATALHNTGRFEECLKVLKTIEVLPYEGSWEARDLFSRTYLRLAMLRMKANDWPGAIRFLESSRDFPEHLGSGKPWEPDERLQDLMTGYCYTRMRDEERSRAATVRILEYTERHGVRWGSEHYAGVLTMRAGGEHEKADRIMQAWEQLDSSGQLLKWFSAYSANRSAEAAAVEQANQRDFRFLLRMEAIKMVLPQ